MAAYLVQVKFMTNSEESDAISGILNPSLLDLKPCIASPPSLSTCKLWFEIFSSGKSVIITGLSLR